MLVASMDAQKLWDANAQQRYMALLKPFMDQALKGLAKALETLMKAFQDLKNILNSPNRAWHAIYRDDQGR